MTTVQATTTELPVDFFDCPVSEVDPEVAEALTHELRRQQTTLEMIASENFVPRAVLDCQGSVLTNKYAEGYPGKRYYGGCEYIDVVEQLAIDRAQALFGGAHVNVQPHSGAQANAAAYFALLDPGDRLMGLSLAHGGHLTHGMKLNLSGRLYEVVPYEVSPETYLIDMDEVQRVAEAHRPKLILAGWSAYPRLLDFERFRAIADEIGALLMVDMAHFAGLVAANLHPHRCSAAIPVTSRAGLTRLVSDTGGHEAVSGSHACASTNAGLDRRLGGAPAVRQSRDLLRRSDVRASRPDLAIRSSPTRSCAPRRSRGRKRWSTDASFPR